MAKNAAKHPDRLSGIQSKKDRIEALETVTRAFTNPQNMEQRMQKGLWEKPIYDPEHTRIAVVDGRVVSAVVMGPRRVRFGPVTVPAMTLGPVATHDDFRKRGYGAATMDDASQYMKEHGFLLAYLQGIPDFYYRFGYYPYIAPPGASFRRDDAKREAASGRLRAMTRADLPAVRRVYDRATRHRICAAAREAVVWEWLFGPGRSWFFPQPKVILDAKGRVVGHLTMNRAPELQIRELVVAQEEAGCRAALGALVREARRREVKEISLSLPYDDRLAVLLRQHVGAEFKMRSHPTGGALLKIVDFPALLRTLEPLLTRRRQESCCAVPSCRFTLSSEIGAVGITVKRTAVRVGDPGAEPTVKIPQRWLPGMLTGYHAVRDVARKKGAVIPRELRRAVEILFPAGWPFVYAGDNY